MARFKAPSTMQCTFIGLLLCSSPIRAAEAGPVSPNASKETKDLLHYLYAIRGKGVLTGVHNYGNMPGTDWTVETQKRTGKYPAVKGLDMGYSGRDDKIFDYVYAASVDYHKKGGLVTFTWHWRAYGAEEDYDGKNIGAAVTPGTPENAAMNRDLDRVADRVLKKLQTQKIPVLWRPFHEMNGGWFWWGNKGEATKKLWIYMFDRYAKHHKLTNLIWVWSPNYSPTPDTEEFPGIHYVDVLGTDYYANDGATAWPGGKSSLYKALQGLAKGKPLCIGECARVPDVDRTVTETPDVAWFLIWGNRVANRVNPVDVLKKEFGSSYAVNRGSLRISSAPSVSTAPVVGTEAHQRPFPPMLPATGTGGVAGNGRMIRLKFQANSPGAHFDAIGRHAH